MNSFFAPENMKKPPSKVAHNWPRPFFLSTANYLLVQRCVKLTLADFKNLKINLLYSKKTYGQEFQSVEVRKFATLVNVI